MIIFVVINNSLIFPLNMIKWVYFLISNEFQKTVVVLMLKHKDFSVRVSFVTI